MLIITIQVLHTQKQGATTLKLMANIDIMIKLMVLLKTYRYRQNTALPMGTVGAVSCRIINGS